MPKHNITPTAQSTAKKLMLRQESLIENPDARVPICLVLDASYSMTQIIRGTTIDTGETEERDGKSWRIVDTEGEIVTLMDELNEGVRLFCQNLLDDPIAKNAAEISIIAFAKDAQIIEDFGPLDKSILSNSLKATNQDHTSLGKGVKLALELLDQRKKEYKNAGVEYFQPWLVVITDGVPTDNSHREIAPTVNELVQSKKLTIFPIGVEGADLKELAVISPTRPPIMLKGAKFKELFEWLSASVSQVSQSTPGDHVPLDKEGIDAWATL